MFVVVLDDCMVELDVYGGFLGRGWWWVWIYDS